MLILFGADLARTTCPFASPSSVLVLTLKLAGYFAKHMQARGGGGFVDPPKNFETANN